MLFQLSPSIVPTLVCLPFVFIFLLILAWAVNGFILDYRDDMAKETARIPKPILALILKQSAFDQLKERNQ